MQLTLFMRSQVGHTGIYDAAVKAITATDAAVGTVAEAASESGYVLLITADHGNAEQMINPETGAPHTAHTTNPVPFIVKPPKASKETYRFISDEEAGKGEKKGETDEGALCDVAPTILDIMVRTSFLTLFADHLRRFMNIQGLPEPKEMTGRSLLARR